MNTRIAYGVQGVHNVHALSDQDVHYLSMYAGHLDSMSAWLIGDCFVASDRLYPNRPRTERFLEIVRLAGMPWSYGHAYNVYRTCIAFPIEERHPDASFELHRLVSHKEREEAHALLDLAVANEWTAAQLRKHMYGASTGAPPEIEVRSISPTELAVGFGDRMLHVFIVYDEDEPKIDHIWK